MLAGIIMEMRVILLFPVDEMPCEGPSTTEGSVF